MAILSPYFSSLNVNENTNNVLINTLPVNIRPSAHKLNQTKTKYGNWYFFFLTKYGKWYLKKNVYNVNKH